LPEITLFFIREHQIEISIYAHLTLLNKTKESRWSPSS
jgi:hypothetical protein